jgi:hypothetical protein
LSVCAAFFREMEVRPEMHAGEPHSKSYTRTQPGREWMLGQG